MWPVLHIAAFFNYHGVIEYLLKSGYPVDQKDHCNFTALHKAVHGDSPNATRLLLQYHPDLEARTNAGYSFIHYEVRNCLTTLPMILKAGCPVDVSTNDLGMTALHELSHSLLWHPDVLKSLQNTRGWATMVNQKDLLGRTPLHLAAGIDIAASAALIERRIRAGSFKVATDIEVVPPMPLLECFTTRGRAGMEVLIQSWKSAGIPVTFDDNNESLLGVCSELKSRLLCFLIEHGADVKSVNNERRTALHLAIPIFHRELDSCYFDRMEQRNPVQVLIEAGIDINRIDSHGRTALDLAFQRSVGPAVRCLLLLAGAGLDRFEKTELFQMRSALGIRKLISSKYNWERWEIEGEDIIPFESTGRQNGKTNDSKALGGLTWRSYRRHTLEPTKPERLIESSDMTTNLQVLLVANFLRSCCRGLPSHILARILDYGKYWAGIEYSIPSPLPPESSGYYRTILESKPIQGVDIQPVREIIFRASSYSRSDPNTTKRSPFYAHNNFSTTTLINLY